jgi:hypothetical protein
MAAGSISNQNMRDMKPGLGGFYPHNAFKIKFHTSCDPLRG